MGSTMNLISGTHHSYKRRVRIYYTSRVHNNFPTSRKLTIKSPYKISQQRSITQITKVASNVANTEARSTSQATCVAGNAAVVDDRCVDQATKVATADKECTSQSTGIASKGLMSTAVLEMLEAIPDHDFFIQ